MVAVFLNTLKFNEGSELMKCNKCIFAKDIDADTVECRNLSADDNGMRLNKAYDGCNDGKASTVALNAQEMFSLKYNMD